MKSRTITLIKTLFLSILLLGHGACGGGGGSSDGASSSSASSSSAAATASPADAAAVVGQALGDSVGRSGTQLIDRTFANTTSRTSSPLDRQISMDAPVNCIYQGLAMYTMLITYHYILAIQRVDVSSPSFSADGTLTLQSCNGFSGELSASMTGSADGQTLTYSTTVSGSVIDENTSPSCTVSMANLAVDVTSSYGSDDYTSTLNGTATATCGSASATCTWNDVNSQDSAALAAGCTA